MEHVPCNNCLELVCLSNIELEFSLHQKKTWEQSLNVKQELSTMDRITESCYQLLIQLFQCSDQQPQETAQ